jgi:ABC-type glycerol-3-phosphate transport system substrate-binding protein
MTRSVRQMGTRTTGLLVVLTLVASGCSSATSSGASSVTATGSAVATTAPESSTTAQQAAGATAAALSDVGVKIVDASAPISSNRRSP